MRGREGGSALSVEALSKGSPQRKGVASEVAERKKRRDYPLINVLPFAVEDHGRFGEDALRFARKAAPAESGKRAIELARLYQIVRVEPTAFSSIAKYKRWGPF